MPLLILFFDTLSGTTRQEVVAKYITKSNRCDCINSGFFQHCVPLRDNWVTTPYANNSGRAAMLFKWSRKSFLVFHEEGLQMHSPTQLWVMMEMQMYFYDSWNKFHWTRNSGVHKYQSCQRVTSLISRLGCAGVRKPCFRLIANLCPTSKRQ